MVFSLQCDESFKVDYNTFHSAFVLFISVYIGFLAYRSGFLTFFKSEFGISDLLNPLWLLKSHFDNLC